MDKDLLRPNSGKSSTRYVGIVSLYSLIALMVSVVTFSCFKEIPHNNAVVLEDIAYSLAAVVVGVYAKTAFEKRGGKTKDEETLN